MVTTWSSAQLELPSGMPAPSCNFVTQWIWTFRISFHLILRVGSPTQLQKAGSQKLFCSIRRRRRKRFKGFICLKISSIGGLQMQLTQLSTVYIQILRFASTLLVDGPSTGHILTIHVAAYNNLEIVVLHTQMENHHFPAKIIDKITYQVQYLQLEMFCQVRLRKYTHMIDANKHHRWIPLGFNVYSWRRLHYNMTKIKLLETSLVSCFLFMVYITQSMFLLQTASCLTSKLIPELLLASFDGGLPSKVPLEGTRPLGSDKPSELHHHAFCHCSSRVIATSPSPAAVVKCVSISHIWTCLYTHNIYIMYMIYVCIYLAHFIYLWICI